LENEQKILRGMATSGIVTASFSHELGNLSGVLASRTDVLTELLFLLSFLAEAKENFNQF
jgi:uncharacterized membrane protein